MITAKKEKPKVERAEFPKPLVRLKLASGGYEAEVLTAANADAEKAAIKAGYQVVTVPEQAADFKEYPKMLYGPGGQQRIVNNAADEEAAEGFEDTPQAPPDEVAAKPAPEVKHAPEPAPKTR